MERNKRERTAVIYVDWDDDLGKLGIQTPLIGEESVNNAIFKFMEYNPEDSDLNTMIAALNIYKKLKESGIEAEIVFISGSSRSGLEASLEFSRKLDAVINELNVNEAYVVYDSPEDAKAIPLIQSRLKIVGIKHVIVEQSRSVEETYALLGRYLKKIIEEPRYSRIAIGVPGVVFLLIGVLSLLGLGQYIGPISLVVLGVFFIIRGYNIDDLFEKWWESSPLMFVSGLISIIILLLGGVYSFVTVSNVMSPKEPDYVYLASYAQAFLPFLVLSAVIFLTARSVSKLLSSGEKYRVWHDIYKIVAVGFIYWILNQSLYGIQKADVISVISNQQNILMDLVLGAVALILTYVVLSITEKKLSLKTS
jgi:putative membrane protein